MCNLYSMTRNREAILRLFRVPHNRAAAYEARDAIFPGYQAPVVRKAADGERELTVLNWGFVLLAEGQGAQAGNEHQRRQGADGAFIARARALMPCDPCWSLRVSLDVCCQLIHEVRCPSTGPDDQRADQE